MMNVRRDRAVWLILIISVGLYLSIPLLSLVVGCKDKAEAIEISDPVDITIEANELSLKIEETDATDITFCYEHNGITEELTLNVVDGEIVCSQPANKAIGIIFKTIYYIDNEQNKGDVYDLPVRFPESNEPECKHENIGDSVISICTVYHTDGSYCWYCPDCGEYVNTKDN